MKKLLLLFTAISLLGCENKETIINYDDITTVDEIAYYKSDMNLVTGKCKAWHKNGQLRLEIIYNEGKPNGVWKQWYENGQLGSEGALKDGKRYGIWKYWHNNGQLWFEATFKEDKPNGIVKEFDENGNLTKEETFIDGQLISAENN